MPLIGTDFWNGTGNWSIDTGDWSTGNPPTSGQNTEIQTGSDTLTTLAAIGTLQVDASTTLQIAPGGSLTSNGTSSIAGYLYLLGGGAASITGDLDLTGAGRVDLDPFFIGGDSGGSSLTISGTLTNASTDAQALDIGNNSIGAGDTLTAGALNNTGAITIVGNGTIQSTLDITTGAAGFGTLGVETGAVYLTSDALLEFASGQIGTIDGIVQLYSPNAVIADAGTLATNSALAGLNTVAGYLYLLGGNSVSVTGDLSVTGSGRVDLDPYFLAGNSGGSSLTINGTLTNSSTDAQAIDIGNNSIGAGDTLTAKSLNNTGAITIVGNGTIQSTLDITTGAAGFGTLGVETGAVYLTSDALLEFASGEIGTIDGIVQLYSSSARIADASTLATNSALTGLNSVAGDLYLLGGNTISVTSNLAVSGSGRVDLDPYFLSGNTGGSSLTVNGTLTNNSSDAQAIDIGNSSIGSGDTLTAKSLNNTGVITITGNGTIQSTLDITNGAAGFGTSGVETGAVYLTSDALLEFAAGEIGTIDGTVQLYTSSARIADASTLATNSALTGLKSVAGYLYLLDGNSVSVTSNLAVTGSGRVDLDPYFISGNNGGSSLSVNGTLTNSSGDSNAIDIGNSSISSGDTLTARALNNTGEINITGNGTIQATLDITTGAAGFGTLGVETGTVFLANDALLEFASGQIGTIDGAVQLYGPNARIADASTLATSSALTGLNTVAGYLYLLDGNAVGITGNLSVTGAGRVDLDAFFLSGNSGGSSLTIGGTLTNSSTDAQAIDIGNSSIGAGDTVTAKALNNTGDLSIIGNGTIQSTLNITNGPAGFGTLAVETGSVALANDALLEFASGQIGTIDGVVTLNGSAARIADAGTLASSSALAGLNTVSGQLYLQNGNSLNVTGNLSITGSGRVDLDPFFLSNSGGSSLTVGGTLTNSSTDTNAIDIGSNNISAGDTLTAGGLNNTGDINVQGNGSIVATLAVNGAATNSATVNIDGSGDVVMGAGDAYTQAAGATNIASGGTLAGTVDVTGGAVNIATGGTLAGIANVTGGSLDGTGTVVGTVNDDSGGTVFGGPSIGTPGTLLVNGTYNQGGTGDLEANIGAGGTTSGVVAVSSGNYVNLSGGTLSVSATPALGSVLTVMTFSAGHLVGQFAAVQDGATIGNGSHVDLGDGTSLEVLYNNDSGNIQIAHVSNASLATSYAWIDGTANWSTAADWSGGQVPNSTANVVIGNTSTGNVTLNSSSGDTTINSLSIHASNTLTVSGVTLTSGTGGGNISVASGGTLSLTGNGEIDGSVLTGAGLLQATGSTGILAGDTIVSGTSFFGQNGANTELLGAIDNAGSIEQFGGAGNNGIVLIGDNATLSGGGTVTLDDLSGGGDVYVEGNGQTLTNSNNTIQGTGIIGNGSLALSNASVVDATPEGGTSTLTLNGSGGVTNTGTLEATGTGVLVISNTVNNLNGNVTVAGASSTVQLSSATVQGGTLNNAAGGVLDTVSSATLDGSTKGALTISSGSTYTASNNATTTLVGVIANQGLLLLNGGSGQNGLLLLSTAGGPVSLEAGGTVTLVDQTGGGQAFVEGNGATLNNVNDTIKGTGIIGNGSLGVVNTGVIDATPEGGTSILTLNGSGGVTNEATLEATGGGILVLATGISNAAGTITVADAASTVELSSASIQSGVLNNSAGGIFATVSSGTLDGFTQHTALTISTGSTYTASNNANTTLLGTIANQGVLLLNGGNGQNGILTIGDAVTLSGGGTLTLTTASGGGTAFIEGNGQTLTNSNDTIQGTGIIGNGSLGLINDSVVDATPEGGTKLLTLNGSAGVTNNDLLEATNGGTLTIATNVTNTGANITANGSASLVDITAGVTVTGGTLNTLSGGVMETAVSSSAVLQAVTVAAGSTYTASNSASTTLLGSIDNLGSIQLNGGAGQNGFLLLGSAVTLTGGGTLTLTTSTGGGSAFVQGNAETLTNTNNTIQGTGIIGNGSLVLVNHGVVDATPEGGTNTLTLNGSGGITNTDLLEATSGGTLTIDTTVTNTGAKITSSGSGSVVDITGGVTITGGTLTTASGGAMETAVSGSTVLQAVTIASGSTYTASNSATTTLLGTIDNVGTIEQIGGGGQNGFLAIGNNVTLTGGGTVLLDDLSGGGSAFLVGNAETLTNTNNKIEGTGVIGNGSLALVNGGVIDATPEGGTSTLTLNGSGGLTSTGTLEATGGATLALNTGSVTASGLVLVGVGSTLSLSSELTVNGTLNNAGAVIGGGATEVAFGSGTNRLILGPGATFGGTVVGGGVNSTIELAAGAGAGTLNALGTNFTNFGTVIVDSGATWTVDMPVSLLASTTITGDGSLTTLALTSAGAVSLTNVSDVGTIDLAAGNNSVTVIDQTLSKVSVTINDGASGNNTISATSDTAASKGKTLTYNAGPGTDSFTGGFENDKVSVSAAAVGGDTLTGGSGTNTLTLTSGGSANLAGVSKFATIDLSAAGNVVTVTDTMLSIGSVTINDAASGNNSVSAAGDTSVSKGKTLTYNAGSGTDSFTGGFETDKVNVSAAAVGGDTLTGGSASNTLTLTTAGSANLGGVSKFATINLAAGNNTVTLGDATLSSGSITIKPGVSGNNSISAAGDTSASKGKTLTYTAGTGTDSFTGGFENDKVNVTAAEVGGDTLTGGSGSNTLTLTSAGTVNLGGVSKFATINLAVGNNTVTLGDATLSGGSVTIRAAATGNNSVSAAGDTSASKGKTLTYYTGTATDSFTGGFENDMVHASAAELGGDTLTGGSGSNTLTLTSAGTVNLGGVSKFASINLAAGNNTVTLGDATLAGGSVTIRAAATGNNSVSAAGDTSASKGKTLTYYTGTATDSFTGGFENDAVHVSAAELGGDTLTGGSGSNTLTLTSAGTVNLAGVSKFGAINLAAGANTVTVTDTTLAGGSVTIKAGATGNNSVSAAGDTSASKGKTLTYYTGTGTDSFTGGFENDAVHVSAAELAVDTLTAGSGTNTLTLTSAGTINLGSGNTGFATVTLAAGNNTVTVTDAALAVGSLTIKAGTSGNNSVSATGDSSASTGKTLTYDAGPGTDSFAGGFETDKVSVSAAAVGGDTLTGGSAANILTMTTAGTVNLGGVSRFATVNLAVGNSNVTVTDTTLSGGAVTIRDGSSGNDTVSAAGDTSASTGKTLTYDPGSGTDHFTGGFETDKVSVTAAAVGGDTLTGGSAANTLTLTTAGTVNLGGVSKFATVDLAAGSNTVTVGDATLSGGSLTIKPGSSGNETISAAGDTAASTGTSLTYTSGSGADSFTGGFENDTIFAGTGLGTYTAGTGNDTFVFIKSSLPTQTLDNFQLGSDDILVYGTHSAGGFNLGTTDNALNPATPTAIDPSIFVANATGAFTSSSQRFAYDTSNGQLFYSATGSNASESTVATLTGAPGLTAANLLFEH